jgi:flavin reductase (DIM6/NTAB) family NADH-FMN oxidoreductase RutF
MDKKAMYKLSYGLFVLTTKLGEKINGCITNTAIQVTTEPNQIAFAVNKLNLTHDMLLESKVFNISIISEEATFDVFKRFGFQSGRDVDKFADYNEYKTLENGIPYITEGTNAYIAGTVTTTVDLGSHTLFICAVTDMDVLNDAKSATYEYYQENIKPKPEAVGTTPSGETVWRCKICGYEYVGEELPDDFICPWCKHPASDFEKVVK